MGTNLLGELAANNGTYFLNNGSYQGNIDQIIVRGDGVVVSKIYVIRDGELTQVAIEYLTSINVPNGLRITPKNNEVFVRVDLGNASSAASGIELVLSA
jgi:hypothetical protein